MGHGYRELVVWQKAMTLAEGVYRTTEGFPKKEAYGLTSQMHRAAVSVPSNIAEGQGRLGKSEFRQFLGQARGSLLELETQIELAARLKYLRAADREGLLALAEEVKRMLNALISKLTLPTPKTRT